MRESELRQYLYYVIVSVCVIILYFVMVNKGNDRFSSSSFSLPSIKIGKHICEEPQKGSCVLHILANIFR